MLPHNPEAEGSSPSPATTKNPLKPSCPKGFSVLHILEVDQENGALETAGTASALPSQYGITAEG